MSIPRSLVIAAIAAGSTVAALPASAGAACATVPFPDLVRVADVVATVEFLPGDADASGTLRTPARARVIRLDQGYASKELQVSTALGAIAFGIEGIRPKAGEVWRLYGTRAPNGSIGTSICSGSVVMPAEPASASITIGGKRRSLVPSSIEGRQRKGRLPAVRIPRRGRVDVRAISPVLDAAASQVVAVRVVTRGRTKVTTRTLRVRWFGRSNSLRGQLPKSKLKIAKRGSTLVIVTREASFAIGLRRPA